MRTPTSHPANAWLRLPTTLLVVLLLTLPAIIAADRNVLPDAITRATTWNTYTGELELLRDGAIPGQDATARPLVWEGGGILVFEWDEPVALHKVRSFIGEIGNNYLVRAYLGGRLDESGLVRDPEGVLTAVVPDDSRKVSQWTQIQFPAGTMADNIEVVALGTLVFYEIEVYALDAEATVIRGTSWGRIKRAARQLTP